MSDTLENLQRKKQTAAKLSAVVRAMKAMAASGITQYEMAVQSLNDYYRTILLGFTVCLAENKLLQFPGDEKETDSETTIAIVFGSDQGLVGKFNNIIADFALQTLKNINTKETWAVGEKITSCLAMASSISVLCAMACANSRASISS